jgi:Flp pilus assembly protein TadB
VKAWAGTAEVMAAGAVGGLALALRPPSARSARLLRTAGSRRRSAAWRRPAAVAVVVVAVALLVHPLAAVAVLAGGLVVGGRRRRALRLRGEQRLVEAAPDAAELAALAVGAGATVAGVVDLLADRGPPPFADAFTEARVRVERGWRRADALDAIVVELGEPSRAIVAALVASERYGVALSPALERVVAEGRAARRRRAEVAARAVPVRLAFPLVGCVLPAFALLTVVPLLAGALAAVRW